MLAPRQRQLSKNHGSKGSKTLGKESPQTIPKFCFSFSPPFFRSVFSALAARSFFFSPERHFLIGRKELRDKRSGSGQEEWEQCESQKISGLVSTLLHTSYVNLGILPSSLSLSFFIREVGFISLTYRTVGIYVLNVKQLTHCLECNESLVIGSYCYYFF